MHENERNFVCHICTRAFGRREGLRRHIADVHEQSGEHACAFCEKKFLQLVDKKIHERKHTKEKPFQCEFCPVKVGRKSTLVAHIKLKHPEESGNQPEDQDPYNNLHNSLASIEEYQSGGQSSPVKVTEKDEIKGERVRDSMNDETTRNERKDEKHRYESVSENRSMYEESIKKERDAGKLKQQPACGSPYALNLLQSQNAYNMYNSFPWMQEYPVGHSQQGKTPTKYDGTESKEERAAVAKYEESLRTEQTCEKLKNNSAAACPSVLNMFQRQAPYNMYNYFPYMADYPPAQSPSFKPTQKHGGGEKVSNAKYDERDEKHRYHPVSETHPVVGMSVSAKQNPYNVYNSHPLMTENHIAQ